MPASERLRLLMHLEKHPQGVAIRALVEALDLSVSEATEFVFALACEGLLTVELGRPFTPETRIGGVRPDKDRIRGTLEWAV